MAKNTTQTNTFHGLQLGVLELPRWNRDRDIPGERRLKVINALQDQLKLIEDPTYKRVVHRRAGDLEKKPAKWWINSGTGVQFAVRYGHTPVELQPGKAAIQVESMEKLPAVIEQLIGLVKQGALDQQFAAIANNHKEKIHGKKDNKTARKAA